MTMDWGNVADWVGVGVSAVTLFLAWKALASWKAQLSGTKRHETAHEIALSARALRYAFYESRSPFISAWEFPDSYRERRHGETPTNADLAAEHAHVYRERLKVLWPYIQACAELRAKAGAVFGDDCAGALEALAKKAREFEFVVAEYVAQLRVGPEVVRQWTDQKWAERVRASISASGERDDPLSLEFEEKMKGLMKFVVDDLA